MIYALSLELSTFMVGTHLIIIGCDSSWLDYLSLIGRNGMNQSLIHASCMPLRLKVSWYITTWTYRTSFNQISPNPKPYSTILINLHFLLSAKLSYWMKSIQGLQTKLYIFSYSSKPPFRIMEVYQNNSFWLFFVPISPFFLKIGLQGRAPISLISPTK